MCANPRTHLLRQARALHSCERALADVSTDWLPPTPLPVLTCSRVRLCLALACDVRLCVRFLRLWTCAARMIVHALLRVHARALERERGPMGLRVRMLVCVCSCAVAREYACECVHACASVCARAGEGIARCARGARHGGAAHG
eukprot:6196876-Pleurochrysis_carterae.AAC.1